MSWRFSASQVSVFEDCPRKWGWRYLDEVFAPPHPSAQFGTEVHGHLESWLKERVVPPETPQGKVAQAMIPYLPPPQAVQAEYVERRFQVSLGGHSFMGYVDLTVPDRDGPPLINDHKTTGDLGWALEPDALPGDVQASLYAFWGFVHTDADAVLLQWLYGRTKGSPVVLPVQRVVTKPEIEPRLLKTVESADQMAVIKSAGIKTAKELPYDASACEKYGGCPYQDKCGLSARERMQSIMAQGQTGDFVAKLRKQKEQQAASAAPSDAADASKASTGKGDEEKADAAPTDVNPPEQNKEPPKERSASVDKKAEAETETAKTSDASKEGSSRGRGRPRGSKNKDKGTGTAASSSSNGAGWTLYIDCAPLRLPADAEAPIKAAEVMGPAGANTKSVEEVRQRLRDDPPASGVLIGSGVGNEYLFAFAQEAESIIQG